MNHDGGYMVMITIYLEVYYFFNNNKFHKVFTNFQRKTDLMNFIELSFTEIYSIMSYF